MFQVHNYSTTRQQGKQLNIIIKYRYQPGASNGDYIEYKKMREVVMYYAEPTPDLPINIYWEAVNLALVKNITGQMGPLLEGISSQIQV